MVSVVQSFPKIALALGTVVFLLLEGLQNSVLISGWLGGGNVQ